MVGEKSNYESNLENYEHFFGKNKTKILDKVHI